MSINISDVSKSFCFLAIIQKSELTLLQPQYHRHTISWSQMSRMTNSNFVFLKGWWWGLTIKHRFMWNKWCLCTYQHVGVCAGRALLCVFWSWRGLTPKYETMYVNLLETAANCICFFPIYGPLSTRQFSFFFLLLSGVPRCFIASHWYCSRTKKSARL